MSWTEIVAIVKRWWWTLAAVALLIGGLSLIGWLGAPPTYSASRSVTVIIAPAGMPSGQQSYLAEQQALATARLIASPGFLTTPAFDNAVARALATTPDATLRRAAPLSLGRALSAAHSGPVLTITASWTSVGGAQSLATAAAAVLAQGNPAIIALFPAAATTGDSPHCFVAPDFAPAMRDEAADATARNTLLQRLALAIVAGALVMGTVGLLEQTRVGGAVPRRGEPAGME